MPKMHLGHGEHSADVSFYYQYDVKRCLWYTVMWIEEAMKLYIVIPFFKKYVHMQGKYLETYIS